MIRIAITAQAFEAIVTTLPLGSVGYENESTAKGERLIWLEARGGRPRGTANSGGAARGSARSAMRRRSLQREKRRQA